MCDSYIHVACKRTGGCPDSWFSARGAETEAVIYCAAGYVEI